MNARILPLDSDEHQAVQALLPWHVNGTLDAAESSRVVAHLAQCVRCQRDAAWQGRLHSFPAADAATEADVDRDWVSMRRRLTPQAKSTPRLRSPAARWTQMRWLPFVVGIQGVLLIALGVAWFGMPPRDEPFRTLGAAPQASAANALVVFRPTATEAEIRRVLRARGARLAGGPTVTDAYLLVLPSHGPEILSRLRGESVVERVESLEAAGAR